MTKTFKFAAWTFAALIFFGYAPVAPAETEEPIYFLGIPPQQNPMEIAKRWTPLAIYLSRKSGVRIQLQTAKDITTFHGQLKQGQIDFSFVNPQTYIQVHQFAGYQAFAKEKGGATIGLIVVRKDSVIQDVSQLDQLTMAFPGPTAFTATTLPRTYLKTRRVEVKPQYVVSIESVYRAVVKGLFQAGGGEARTYGSLDPQLKKDLRILWESKPLPPFPFFAHPRVSPEVVKRVQRAMLEMDEDAQGQALLSSLNFKAFEAADDADYDIVRKMHFVHDVPPITEPAQN